MRILHIITGLNNGGAEAVLTRLCLADRDNRHSVISLMDEGKYGPILRQAGITVHCLNMPRGRVTLRGLWRLWSLLRRNRPNVVQTWMYHANLVGGVMARLAGIRNVVWGIRHTTLVPGQSSFITILVAKLCARLSRYVPKLIVCCAEKARHVHVELGYDRNRMVVIPNGYDLSVFQPDRLARQKVRQELSLKPNEKVVGFVARYDHLKDHETFLSAVLLLKKQGIYVATILVGSKIDNTSERLIEQIKDKGLSNQVYLLGRRDDIPDLMNAIDLHVMSSISEAFPNVLAEAMACGTPCVSTDVGDAALILGDTGRIVPPRDPEALALAISDLLAECGTSAWVARKEAARRQVAENFAIERMIERYHAIWAGVNGSQVTALENK